METTYPSACPLDCPDSCSLEVSVESGRVTGVRGSHSNPLTQGFVCSKVRNYARHTYSDARITSPGLRTGPKGSGAFRDVSWDEAMATVSERLAEAVATSGGTSILPLSYGGSNGLLTQDTTDALLFRRLGASQLLRTVCAAPSTAAQAALYGRMPGVALTDYEHARLIVVWGSNPSATGIHLIPIIQRARQAGAQLVVVDPRATPLAKQADLWIAPRPGSDLALALALIRELYSGGHADDAFLSAHTRNASELRQCAQPWTLERTARTTDVPAADIERFATLYRSSNPAVIRCGWGVERNRNGGSAVAAILALPAVAGKFAVRGGGYTMSNSGAWDFPDLEDETPPGTRREVNMNQMGSALTALDPPIEVLFVYNCNPLATLPNQQAVQRGLERDDLFTVVFDPVMTDTARYADVVLPATTFLEHHDLARGYGAFAMHEVRPVIEPIGQARPNHHVFADLLDRLNLSTDDEDSTLRSFRNRLLEELPEQREQLASEGIARPPAGSHPVQFVDVFPNTPDRRIDLFPESLNEEAPLGLFGFHTDPGSEEYPLALISPAGPNRISSTFGQLDQRLIPLVMHPDDASARGLTPGERIRVWNALGEVVCHVEVSRAVRPGVVALEKGLWRHHTESGTSSNSLVPEALTDLGGGACFNDARVQVEAAPPRS